MASSSADADIADALSHTDDERLSEIVARSEGIETTRTLSRSEPITLRLHEPVYAELVYSLDEGGEPTPEEVAPATDELLAAAADFPAVHTTDGTDATVREVTVRVSPETRRAFVGTVREARVEGNMEPSHIYHTCLVSAALAEWDEVME